MLSQTLLVGAFAAFAAAQSTVLTFTHVPNPVTDGHPQAITYATNDTSSVSWAAARAWLCPADETLTTPLARHHHPAPGRVVQPPDHRDVDHHRNGWPVYLDSFYLPARWHRLRARN